MRHSSKKHEARIALLWRGNLYPFGKATWGSDGIFVFRSAYHKNLPSPIESGDAIGQNNKLVVINGTQKRLKYLNARFTLHPPTKSKDGCMLFHGDKDEILLENRRSIDWFPVKHPFHLLTVVTPSLQYLKPTSGTFSYQIPFPHEYTGSVRCKFDCLPPATTVYAGPANLLAVTPNYILRLSFLGTGEQCTDMITIWPNDKELSL